MLQLNSTSTLPIYNTYYKKFLHIRKIYIHIPHINNMIALDLKDKKLLTALDENSRYSNSQIAKKVGLSKPAVSIVVSIYAHT